MVTNGRIPLSLVLGLLFACDGGGDRMIKPPPPVFPSVVTFEADKRVVLPGETVTLTYEVSDATQVSINPGLLNNSTQLSGQVTAEVNQTTTFELIARSAAGETNRTLVVTVQTDGEVRIVNFAATPAIVEPGGTVQLSWTTEGATQVTLSELGGQVIIDQADLVGNISVQPQGNTTYQLSARRGDDPAVTQDVMVLVGVTPVINSFVANPTQITSDPATLSWSVDNADEITLRSADGTLMQTGLPATGSQAVTPAQTTEYTLIAANSVGNATANVTVTVLPPGSARILSFKITPTTLNAPGQVDIEWETADADTVNLTADGTAVDTFPRTPMGTMMLQVAKTTTFELVAENGMGASTDQVVVTVGNPDTMAPVIQHVAVVDGQQENMPVDVVATIMDADSGVGGATLFYRAQGAATFMSASMTDEGNDRFRATIAGSEVSPPGVEYYIHATDSVLPTPNAGTDPVGAPANLHSFTVTPDDQVPPTITHTPITLEQTENDTVNISATITDTNGVMGATLYYRTQGAPMFTSLAMNNSAGSTFEASITAAPPGMEYYLEASDSIVPANVGRDPVNAPTTLHSFSVEALDVTPPGITHTPVSNGQQAGGAVTVTVDVTDATGVGPVTLYYKQAAAGSYTSVVMTGAMQTKVAQIPAGAVTEPRVDYYVEAFDTATPTPNMARVPATAPGTPYSFTVSAIDTAPPTISHTAIQDGRAAGQPVTVSADVVDASGVAVVTLYYRTQGNGTFSTATMNGGPTYVATIPAGTVADPGVEYYLQATDASPQANSATLPSNAPTGLFAFVTGTGEAEPNNTAAQATPFLSGTRLSNIGLGGVSPATDRDFWLIDVPAGANRYTMDLEVTIGGVGVCAAGDTRMKLYDSDGTTILVNDDSDGIAACSKIDPAADVGARALAPGQYYIEIEEDGNNATIATYELRGSMSVAVCGNGILETAIGEQCEDGNTTGGDGCSATCQIEPDGTFTGTGGTQTGAISPAGDADIYAVVVGAGQFLRAEVDDGAGACPGDSVLELYDTDGITLLGTDDDGGVGSCSLIDPDVDAWAANMTAGTYFLRVRGYNNTATLPSYTLTVSITDNICGNGQLEGAETCDDGNSTSFDGCSSACQWETAGTAMGAGGSFSDAISPVGNIDWFEVIVPAGYSIRAETFAPVDGSCAVGNDTVMRLYAADRTTQIFSDDDGGTERCSLIDPATDAAARGLAAGSYFISIEDYNNNDTIAAYVLNIAIQAPVCGDGFLGGTEACDDGNMVDGDGCSSTCNFEGPGEQEPNGTIATAGQLVTAGNFSGQVYAALPVSSDVDIFSVVVPANYNMVAEIHGTDGGCPVNTTLRLRNASGTSLVSDTSAGPGSCGRLAPGADSEVRDMAAGTYYLEVTGTADPDTYILDVQLLPTGCGDLYLEGTESCDDGNTNPGDGCSATCTFELLEMEPNNTATSAQALGANEMVSATINVAQEHDWFAVTVPANASLFIASHEGAMDQCPSPIDTVVTVFDGTGTTQIANDDLDGPGLCSAIYGDEAGGLAAGTYLIRVRPFSSSATFDYALTVDVR